MSKKGMRPSKVAAEEISVRGTRFVVWDKINYRDGYGQMRKGVIAAFRLKELGDDEVYWMSLMNEKNEYDWISVNLLLDEFKPKDIFISFADSVKEPIAGN